jgi:hypothetical protein
MKHFSHTMNEAQTHAKDIGYGEKLLKVRLATEGEINGAKARYDRAVQALRYY